MKNNNINMTNGQILIKAMEQARKNGYRGDETLNVKAVIAVDVFAALGFPIIFSHSFAKAFFTEEFLAGSSGIKLWEERLQQMVLEKNPYKFLERYLKIKIIK